MKLAITRALTLCLLLTAACFCSFAQSRIPQEQALEIPFDFYRNEIILQVKVNGKGPFNMMLDTGTDPSAVDLATARELRLKLQLSGATASGGGTEANLIYQTKLPLVEVGPLTVKNLETMAIDLSKMSERLGKTLHGVLGHSLLNGRIAQIDYPNRQSCFSAKELDETRSPGASTSAMRFSGITL